MAFVTPTLPELITRVTNDINARLSGLKGFVDARLRRSMNFVHAHVIAQMTKGLHNHIADVALQVIPDTADTENLKRHASLYDVTQTQAAKAQGNVTFTGTDPTNIPATTEIQLGDGETYTVDVGGNLSGGTIDLAVTAVDAGADGNAVVGLFVELINPIAGVDNQATVAAGGLTGGLEEDTDAQLLTALRARVQDPPQGGAVADYVQWVKDAKVGIDRVFVSELELGAGTVVVRFTVPDTGSGVVPDSATRTAALDSIIAQKQVTAIVTVPDPAIVAHPVPLTMSITPDTAAIRTAVEAQLDALWLRDAVPGGTIKNSRIREAISTATGEDSHTLSAVDGGSATADVVLAQTDIAVTETPTYT